MRKKSKIILLLLAAFCLVAAGTIYGAGWQTKVHMEQGGDQQTIESGGKVAVKSGGALDVESGGALKIAGTAVTSSAAELNILDGVTADSTEINYIDGVTSAIQTQINGKEPTITAGSTAQYLRGDKSLGTLNKAAVAGLTNTDSPLFAAVTVGSGGTQIDQIKMYVLDSVDVDTVAANTTEEKTVAVTGLTTSDFVFINPWTAMETGLAIGSVRVSAPDVLSIQFVNVTAAAIDPAAKQYDIVVFRKH